MYQNKHVIAALIIAPILSIIAYWAVDAFVAERPHQAKRGVAYPLIPESNCRYQSGICEMKNGNFEISIQATYLANGQLTMLLSAAHPLKGVGVSISNKGAATPLPLPMTPTDKTYQQWTITVAGPKQGEPNSMLRLALVANESFYYAESGLAFVDYETAYEKDFR